MKRIACWLLLAVLMMGLISTAKAENIKISYTGTVKEGSVHLRKTPSATGRVLNTYKKGAKADILENDGTWCKVQFGKRTGYMMASYLNIQPNYPHIGWGQTANDGTILNLRREADASSPILYKTMSGAVFELIAREGQWYQVRAGKTVGYLEADRIRQFSGDFSLGFSSDADRDSVTILQLHSAARETGSPATQSHSDGNFTYEIHTPHLNIAAADQAIATWVDEIKQVFARDHDAHHADVHGALAVEYQTLNVGSRYMSVVLMGEYTVGELKTEVFRTLNIDTQTGKVISPGQLFNANVSRALFCLESGISPLMATPTDGYTGKPEKTWLQYAALNRNGVDVYLPAGLYLPASLGSRKVHLTYAQVAECLGLSDDFLKNHRRVIDPSKPMIALTFDDGPSEETDRIVKVLAQYNARATFCVIGNKVEAYADVLKRTVAGGNEIACHTWSHPKLTTKGVGTIRSQITKTNQVVQDVAGVQIKVLRPPYGAVNKNVRNVCKENDMSVATWNIDTLDWSTRNTTKTYRAVMRGAQNGNIILMHDLYSTTAAAVEKAVPELVEKGFQLVTVSELMAYHKDGIKPGTLYSNLDPKNMKSE